MPQFKWSWYQNASTVTITFPTSPGTKREQLDVQVTATTIKAGLKNQAPIIEVRYSFGFSFPIYSYMIFQVSIYSSGIFEI
jgi:hypothetical protein